MILDGVNNVATIERIMRQTVEQAPTVHIEYLAVCDPDSLEPLDRVDRSCGPLGRNPDRVGPSHR